LKDSTSDEEVDLEKLPSALDAIVEKYSSDFYPFEVKKIGDKLSPEQKERLQDIGSTLHASTFSIQALRIKDDGTEKATKSAKRANTIRVAFQIDKNRITPSGPQDLYICITAPDGKAFGDGGTISTREDGNKAFSNKVAVQYEQNAVLPVSYDVKNANKFIEGEYKIEVYHNGFKIGEGKTSLKKGGLF
jgi:mRNA-degrading endonuclease RelE of RelBE toxin-antitoxin system